MGAAVVHGVELIFVVEHGDGVAASGDYHAAAFFELVESACPDLLLQRGCHQSASHLADVGS